MLREKHLPFVGVGIVLCLLTAGQSDAHIGGLSNIELNVNGADVDARVTVLRYDFGYLVRDILTGMPEVPADEVLASEQKIFSYIPKRLRLFNGPALLAFQPVSAEIYEKTGDLVVTGTFRAPAPITELRIDCTLFQEPDSRHQNIVTINAPNRWDLVVLRNDQTTVHTLSLAGGSFWSRFTEFILFYVGAFSLGAIHALTPGHGKTLVGAYLVGSRGRLRDAVILGGIVTLTHTGGIFILGFIMVAASAVLLPAQVQMWASFLSGLLVLAVGIWLLYRRMYLPLIEQRKNSQRHEHVHHHDHEHHQEQRHKHDDRHHHDHDHVHGPTNEPEDRQRAHLLDLPHTHAIPAAGAVTLGTLLTLGISGGIVPCPEALVALLMATGAGKSLSGIAFVFFFSIGLAAVLISIGITMVKAGQLFQRRFKSNKMQRVAFGAAAFSAVLITAIGGFMCLKYGRMLVA